MTQKNKSLYIIIGMGVIIITLLFTLGDNNKEKDLPVYTPTDDTIKPLNYVNTTSKGYILTFNNGAYYIDGYLIVNKSYSLASNWRPLNPYIESSIDVEAYAAWQKMRGDAAAIGLNLWLASGYRSYKTQEQIFNRNLEKHTREVVETYSARAGHSEHQTGLSIDLNTVTDAFANTDESRWINENAHLYGYIIRYPYGKMDETGFKYEPWHLRYVGLDLANKLFNNGEWLSMEYYFGLESKYID